MSNCPQCQAELNPASRFCTGCGAPNPDYQVPAAAGSLEKTFLIGTGNPVAPPPSGPVPAASGPAVAAPSRSGTVPVQVPGTGSGQMDKKDDISKIFETSGVCPQCYTPLKKGSSQCQECGYRLTGDYCGTCGKAVPAGAAFCAECKTQALLPAAAPSAGTATAVTAAPEVPPAAETVTGPAAAIPPAGAGAASPAAAGRKRGGLVLALLGGAFLLLVLLGTGGWLGWRYFQQRNADPAESGTGSTGIAATAPEAASSMVPPGTSPAAGESSAAGPDAYLQQAQNYFDQGDYPRAREAVKRYLQEKKDNSAAYLLSARIAKTMNQFDEARQDLQTALSFDSENGRIHLELSEIYLETGFSSNAIRHLQEAVRLLPESEEALRQLTLQLTQAGDQEQAKRCASLYLKKFPGGTWAVEIQSLLDQISRPAATTATGTARPGGRDPARPGVEESRPAVAEPPSQPPPPPAPSPYVDLTVDGTALNLPGKSFEVNISFGGISQKFSSGSNMRLDNVEKGSFPYVVSVTYFILASGERDNTYSGSGSIAIRYPNQRLILRRAGDRIIMQ